ncbi:MAG: hypothetical protein AB7O49_22000 [Sphingomonadales bacterium]
MATPVRLTSQALLVCGLGLGWLSSPAGPPLALIGALGLVVDLVIDARRLLATVTDGGSGGEDR